MLIQLEHIQTVIALTTWVEQALTDAGLDPGQATVTSYTTGSVNDPRLEFEHTLKIGHRESEISWGNGLPATMTDSDSAGPDFRVMFYFPVDAEDEAVIELFYNSVDGVWDLHAQITYHDHSEAPPESVLVAARAAKWIQELRHIPQTPDDDIDEELTIRSDDRAKAIIRQLIGSIIQNA